MKDRFECQRLAKSDETGLEYVSEFTMRWRQVDGFETEADPEGWKTPGDKTYVFCKGGNVFCLLANYRALVAEWDAYLSTPSESIAFTRN